MRTQYQSYNQQHGFNLVEVVISIVISTIALLGLAGLHISSINTANVAHAQLHAMQMLSEMANQLYSNSDAAKQGAFDIDTLAQGQLKKFSDMGDAPADNAPTITKLKYYWFQNLNELLPDAKSAIKCTTTGKCVLKIEYINMDRKRLAEQTELEQVLSIQL